MSIEKTHAVITLANILDKAKDPATLTTPQTLESLADLPHLEHIAWSLESLDTDDPTAVATVINEIRRTMVRLHSSLSIQQQMAVEAKLPPAIGQYLHRYRKIRTLKSVIFAACERLPTLRYTESELKTERRIRANQALIADLTRINAGVFGEVTA